MFNNLTVIYSTRESKPEFIQHLKETSGLKSIQVIEYVNNGETSLTTLYNKGISESINDICVTLHDDIILEKNWGKKLLKDFEENPDVSIIGKAGTLKMPESGIYWEGMREYMVGLIWHKIGDKPKYLSSYSAKLDNLVDVVTVDGVFMAFNKTLLKHKFDEEFEQFHFYDHSFCIPNYLDGCRICVTFSFDLTHKSAGETNNEFEFAKLDFITKYGEQLPIEVKNKKIFYKKSKKIVSNKKQPKVSVIIPHIHKNELLFNCIDSLLVSTVYNQFEIVIADTGSSDETKNEIKEKYKDNSNIKLVEYDYYRFSAINNDVVKNHLSPDSKYILFLNNDIIFLNDCDVLSNLSEALSNKNDTASVGCRLGFKMDENGSKLQHGGMLAYLTNVDGDPKQKRFDITHRSLNSYYSYDQGIKEIIGCTAACLLVRRNVFEKLGGFNEGYQSCFEDVELAFNCITHGYKNLIDGDSFAFHYESQTRNDNEDKIKLLQEDYVNHLLPFVQTNFEKLKQYIYQF